MKPYIKRQWVEALRSGGYPQGEGLLRNTDDEFCCLGVLCDLAVKAGVIDRPRTADEFGDDVDEDAVDRYWYGNRDSHSATTLPRPVFEWAGLDTDNPEVTPGYTERSVELAVLNDEHTTFDDIADLIEEQL